MERGLTHIRRGAAVANKHTTPDLINLGALSLKGKNEDMHLEERKTNRMLRCG